ncbi:uncharacterized protein LOC126278662 isoform X2 [Schistocerca gregaria]|uniref:uncharacterized protein LOC126278662 isoform X2 n=1 Tax=Schistocerca gregaria TaxID=7010 RepID=UPI00211E58CA|nr:uncharacterized protein LOC126278662 isoform X2 [Schistocerca gregaria]
MGLAANFLLQLLVSAAFSLGDGLRLLEVRVPVHAVRGQTARLECRFDLEGESLYSVKWYKDGREFYRFVPRDTPPAQLFPLPGVAVEIANSTSSRVVLRDLTAATSGRYRCEVSGEAPSFQTVSDHGDLLVVGGRASAARAAGGGRWRGRRLCGDGAGAAVPRGAAPLPGRRWRRPAPQVPGHGRHGLLEEPRGGRHRRARAPRAAARRARRRARRRRARQERRRHSSSELVWCHPPSPDTGSLRRDFSSAGGLCELTAVSRTTWDIALPSKSPSLHRSPEEYYSNLEAAR